MRENINKKIIFLILVIILFNQGFLYSKENSKIRDLTLLEMANIAQAMEAVYIDIGYYVSIENLNDLLNGNPIKLYDNIDQFNGTPVIDSSTGFFKPELVDLTKSPHLWLGPYITYQPSRISEDGAGYDPGTPLDLSSRPYYFFTPMGLVRPPSRTVTQDIYGDYFDTCAIVSLGPDGIKSSDDIVYRFGSAPTSLVISRLSPNVAYSGDLITIGGYNFGTTRNPGIVKINNIQMSEIIQWTDRSIIFKLGEGAQSGNVVIVSGSKESNPLYLTVLGSSSLARRFWEIYE